MHQLQDLGGGEHGALVQEAAKLMAEEEDDAAGRKEQEETGPKIKMGRIGKGKKGKKRPADGAAGGAGESYTKQLRTTGGDMESRPTGPLNESDVEFMKKAIQILC